MSLSNLRPAAVRQHETLAESPEQFQARLAQLSAALAETAEGYDDSGAFPHENFRLLHEQGLVALTVPANLGGGGASLPQALDVISAVAGVNLPRRWCWSCSTSSTRACKRAKAGPNICVCGSRTR